ncbi:hypothetical protein [Rhabdochromatium marinum]|uniref:hypothetical protein n=1 Tax=Rhabdochromatium marinum TaxID=48729 RepID=UPI0019057E89|nr:hypothetical protein [Rhabdochromatium marinum]MBK1647194.1 hypothetical protein [Rhabdochromatium marinum]
MSEQSTGGPPESAGPSTAGNACAEAPAQPTSPPGPPPAWAPEAPAVTGHGPGPGSPYPPPPGPFPPHGYEAAYGAYGYAPGYAPPGYAPPPGAGYPPGYGEPGPGVAHGQPGAQDHTGHGRQAGVSQVIDELASGGNGLNSLSRLLNFDDTEFWKGALVGAAAVMLLTNESVQNTLFGGRAKNSRSGNDQGADG